MNWLTRSTLILLRLAIGCHFLIEGMGKVQDPAWTSAPFLRAATGPLAPKFQDLAGDPVVEAFAVRPLGENEDPAQAPPHTRMPPVVERQWNAYYNAFVNHYLPDEGHEQQRAVAEGKFQQQKDQFVLWLLRGEEKMLSTGPGISTPVQLERSIPDQVRQYQGIRQEMRALQNGELALFHSTPRPVPAGDPRQADAARNDPQAKYLALKVEAGTIRARLLGDLKEQNQEMKKALDSALTPAQKALGPVPERPLVVWRTWQPVQSLDWLKTWGWAAVGLVLMCSALAQMLGAVAGRTQLGWFGGFVFLLALAAGGLLLYQLYQGREQIIAGLRQPEWVAWFLWWSLAVVGAILMVNALGQIIGHWRDWNCLGGAGWLASLAIIVLGAGMVLGALYYLSVNWDWQNTTPVEKTDWLVIWGVTMVGVCLLLGSLTRTACLAGAVLLVLFVLPGWPETMQQAGPFIKNLIEGLALVTLATTRSGRWLGVDGALQFLNPWRWTAPEPVFVPASGKLLPIEG